MTMHIIYLYLIFSAFCLGTEFDVVKSQETWIGKTILFIAITLLSPIIYVVFFFIDLWEDLRKKKKT